MSAKARKTRTKKLRRREKAKIKFGPKAGPTHKRKGGRTGRGISSEKSVRA
jgi:hypothetical protein